MAKRQVGPLVTAARPASPTGAGCHEAAPPIGRHGPAGASGAPIRGIPSISVGQPSRRIERPERRPVGGMSCRLESLDVRTGAVDDADGLQVSAAFARLEGSTLPVYDQSRSAAIGSIRLARRAGT